MTVAKVVEALEKLDALDDVLQDISPARVSYNDWQDMTSHKLISIRRYLENELVHQEKEALARLVQSNTGLQRTADTSEPVHFKSYEKLHPADDGESPAAAKP
jgi:hypothetical protein